MAPCGFLRLSGFFRSAFFDVFLTPTLVLHFIIRTRALDLFFHHFFSFHFSWICASSSFESPGLATWGRLFGNRPRFIYFFLFTSINWTRSSSLGNYPWHHLSRTLVGYVRFAGRRSLAGGSFPQHLSSPHLAKELCRRSGAIGRSLRERLASLLPRYLSRNSYGEHTSLDFSETLAWEITLLARDFATASVLRLGLGIPLGPLTQTRRWCRSRNSQLKKAIIGNQPMSHFWF